MSVSTGDGGKSLAFKAMGSVNIKGANKRDGTKKSSTLDGRTACQHLLLVQAEDIRLRQRQLIWI
jgi:hypothetical protein